MELISPYFECNSCVESTCDLRNHYCLKLQLWTQKKKLNGYIMGIDDEELMCVEIVKILQLKLNFQLVSIFISFSLGY